MLHGTLLRFRGVALLAPTAGLFATLAFAPASAEGAPPTQAGQSDPLVERRASLPGKSQVIVRAVNSASPQEVAPIIERAGGNLKRQLAIINSQVAEVPNGALKSLVNDPLVARVSLDRLIAGSMERTGATIGSTAIRQNLGYDGSGVGVAIIDSGVSNSHDDLTGSGHADRVVQFADFVGNRSAAYDDYGHGTHVAGIVAGNGFDSS